MKQSNSILNGATDEKTPMAFGPPPLFAGEDERAYQELTARLRETVNPADIIEEMFLRDVVDQQWDVLRFRALKAHLSTFAIRRNLKWELELLGVDVSEKLVNDWVSREPRALAEMDRLLKDARVDLDLAIAACLKDHLEQIERIDQLATRAEARRNAHLHEIERHRVGFGTSLRNAVALVEAQPAKPAQAA
jgi:hypothetical protein